MGAVIALPSVCPENVKPIARAVSSGGNQFLIVRLVVEAIGPSATPKRPADPYELDEIRDCSGQRTQDRPGGHRPRVNPARPVSIRELPAHKREEAIANKERAKHQAQL
jgi:hypothetical protein